MNNDSSKLTTTAHRIPAVYSHKWEGNLSKRSARVRTWDRVALLNSVQELYEGADSCSEDPEHFGEFAKTGDTGKVIDEEAWDLPWVRLDHSGVEVELSITRLAPLDELHLDPTQISLPQERMLAPAGGGPTVQPDLLAKQAKIEAIIWASHIAPPEELRRVWPTMPEARQPFDCSFRWLDFPSVRRALHRYTHCHLTLKTLLTGSSEAYTTYEEAFTEGVGAVINQLIVHQRLYRGDEGFLARPVQDAMRLAHLISPSQR